MQNKSDQSFLAGVQVLESATAKFRNGREARDVVHCEQTRIYND